MMSRPRATRFTAFALILAALAVHCDLPRLHLAFRMGDTLNALRVMDAVQHNRMARLAENLPRDAELARALKDGQESLELIGHTPVLNAVAPPRFRLPALDVPAAEAQLEVGEALPLPLPALAARLLESALPPPPRLSLARPPLAVEPCGGTSGRSARAPPLAWL